MLQPECGPAVRVAGRKKSFFVKIDLRKADFAIEEIFMQWSSCLILPVLAFIVSALQIQSFTNPGAGRRETSATRRVSRIHESVTEEFSKAWSISKSGTVRQEGLVLIFRTEGGGYEARSQGTTNQDKSFTFKWHPDIAAIVHTHPNDTNPRPSSTDRQVADKYGVPVFTITSRGMYVYDPATKKVSLVMEGLDWLDASKWTEEVYSKLTSCCRYPHTSTIR
ncbi:MAG: Mov34/MPN/PAD-1 family protein [Blastocatellia bacterium]|nr:Mov34/MPN/PAD-1 family protein [Blastocatellia bacterium]